MKEYQIVSSIVLEQQGSFKRERRWYAGHNPELGILTHGWQGEPQTIQDVEIITPVATVTIYESNRGNL